MNEVVNSVAVSHVNNQTVAYTTVLTSKAPLRQETNNDYN